MTYLGPTDSETRRDVVVTALEPLRTFVVSGLNERQAGELIEMLEGLGVKWCPAVRWTEPKDEEWPSQL